MLEREIKRLLEGGFQLQIVIDRRKSGKVAKRKDEGVRPQMFGPPLVNLYPLGLQTEGPEVSTVGGDDG